MKKMIYNTRGSADVLEIIETATPVRSGEEVLIELRAVSINPLDWKLRNGFLKLGAGKNLNRGFGIDLSGVVSAASGRSGIDVGDEVFGAVKDPMKQGVLGEYAVVSPEGLAHKPGNISHAQAAAITSVGAPAIIAIEGKAQVSPGQQVLINGAGGGVGMIAVQVAKRAGATVTAVAGTRALPLLSEWGADHIINYSEQDVTRLHQKFDLVLELSGRLSFNQARPIMKRTAEFITLMGATGPPNMAIGLVGGLTSRKKFRVLVAPATKPIVEKLAEYAKDGLQIHIGDSYPFADAAAGYAEIEARGTIGKAVITL